ncbi:MAG TPA: aminomethyl-transferring glycine dehydrogenase subunit GcvPA [Armatimonadota bacterium]|nr:aminomethyl-transferring glycine dehydrogenase subunit GcvPA [Armatimonadota bacterium]HOM80572.1 aminomethyl-transferring glycine dehydrogenase subunit GcvPA [Armatimonadota bacterium]HPO72561.1 aminomethyl-transferring glycine dehydrogenase subunit GcvPA [Armatimonadota bacterium]
MRFLPGTEADRREMLHRIGASSVEELFAEVPPEGRVQGLLRLPPALSEPELLAHLGDLAARTTGTAEYCCFLGAGVYDHYIPAVVPALVGRTEFLTAYTPYQAEISQGLLQSIYEYQTLVCQLTGMDAANASMYDGATALAEAAIMAGAATRRNRFLLPRTIHPYFQHVVATYLAPLPYELVQIPQASDGGVDREALERELDERVAAVLFQHPNFYGCLEDARELCDAAHRVGALAIAAVDPISLGLLTPPGEYGADIVVAEGQSLGNSLSFGGPLLGLMACRSRLLRNLPGRLVGATTDRDGRVSFCLTLQAREQHIRREKASSNICTNQALNALAATVYLCTLGKQGLRRVAELCLQKAHYAHSRLQADAGFTPIFSRPFFKEFALKAPEPVASLNERLRAAGILGGLDLGRLSPELEGATLLCVTERRTREQIDTMVAVAAGDTERS